MAVEQIIRPTGLTDPEITIKPAKGQEDDLLGVIRDRVNKGERVLVTTLTKRMAEDLTEYYHEIGIKVRYLHAEVDTCFGIPSRNKIQRWISFGNDSRKTIIFLPSCTEFEL